MTSNFYQKVLGVALLGIVSLPALADTEFRAKKMTRDDLPLGKGQCDIRLRIDGEAEVSLRGDMVYIRTITGRDGRDEGSECNEPLPLRAVDGFNFEVRDQRGEMVLLSEPTPRTGFRAVVRIRDSEGGEGRYHFRLSWRMQGGGSGAARGPGYGPSGPPPGRAFTVVDAIAVCRDAVRNYISSAYRYDNAEVFHERADPRPGRNDWVIGDASAQRGASREEFIFSCQADSRSGFVRSLDVRRR